MSYEALRWPLRLSILAALLTIMLKATAYLLTNSVGFFSDALESGVNLLAALAASFSLWYANKPSDREHPYGHEKIEFFSSGLEGALVFAAGLGTAGFAMARFIQPKSLDEYGVGLILGAIAGGINGIVAIWLLRVGKKYGSIILEADGHHLLTDVLTTAAVLLGVGLVWLTGLQWLDPLLAFFVGLNILYTGFKLVRRSFDGLMDRAWPQKEIDELRTRIRALIPAGTDFHHLRTRRAGRRRFLDFHLLVSGALSVNAAHKLAHEVEDHLKQALPELEVTIHIEPIEDRSSWEAAELAKLGERTEP